MDFDQRQSFRSVIPEGREQAALLVGDESVDVRIVDESAGGFAVALCGDVDIRQNQVHALKSAAGLYETRVARIEHFSDGRLLGLMRLRDLPVGGEEAPDWASWGDYLFWPSRSFSVDSGTAAGIGVTAIVGMLLGLLALYCIAQA
ncbi:MAG: hypothetical protein ACR2FY_04420 [Pirellulaceae bacterium]